ncbi:hypothetical protein TNCV_4392901 [Trichonephila clavipes]|nr:hypothetical protein TNCV_4392901 [Trichonephila clavipes]
MILPDEAQLISELQYVMGWIWHTLAAGSYGGGESIARSHNVGFFSIGHSQEIGVSRHRNYTNGLYFGGHSASANITVVTNVGAPVAWGNRIIDAADTAVAMPQHPLVVGEDSEVSDFRLTLYKQSDDLHLRNKRICT